MGLVSKLFGRREQPSRWVQFKSKPNDKIVLHEKALALAPLLVGFAHSQVPPLAEFVGGHGHDQGLIMFEALALDIHVVDRVAFEQLGSDRRPWFIDPLLHETLARIAALVDDEARAFGAAEAFASLYSLRIEQYKDLPLAIDSGGKKSITARGTVAWKFADNLPIGEASAERYGLVLALAGHLTELFRQLQVRDLVGS